MVEMAKLNRRGFLKTAGVGAAGVAAAAILPGGLMTASASVPSSAPSGILTFRAVGGLPQGNFPSYSTLVVEGRVNLKTRSGVITKNVYAGPPNVASTIALPGLSRLVRVTKVSGSDSSWLINGTVDDKSQLLASEADSREFTLDLSSKVAKTSFMGSSVDLKIE